MDTERTGSNEIRHPIPFAAEVTMPCIRAGTSIICFSAGWYRLRLRGGGYVFMEWHRYLGPIFFKDRAGEREVTFWWENEEICEALDWFQNRGYLA